jgi:hypothetical protein
MQTIFCPKKSIPIHSRSPSRDRLSLQQFTSYRINPAIRVKASSNHSTTLLSETVVDDVFFREFKYLFVPRRPFSRNVQTIGNFFEYMLRNVQMRWNFFEYMLPNVQMRWNFFEYILRNGQMTIMILNRFFVLCGKLHPSNTWSF